MTSYVLSIKRYVLLISVSLQGLIAGRQAEYVWMAPGSMGTIIFVLNRYLPLIDTFMSLQRESLMNHCKPFLDSKSIVLTGHNTPEASRPSDMNSD